MKTGEPIWTNDSNAANVTTKGTANCADYPRARWQKANENQIRKEANRFYPRQIEEKAKNWDKPTKKRDGDTSRKSATRRAILIRPHKATLIDKGSLLKPPQANEADARNTRPVLLLGSANLLRQI